MYRRPVHSKRNNRLNILVAGSGGSGKSTLVNALCGGHEVASSTKWLDAHPSQAAQPRPLKLKTYTEDMTDPELGSITLRLVETQGFGENLDNSQSVADIATYIAGQYDDVLAEESRIKRNPRFTDNRVHVVLYLIEATGHGLREQDIEFFKAVGPLANVIPLIAKSDALTPTEVLSNKRLIHEDFEHYNLPLFQFLNEDGDYSEEEAENLRRLQESLPLAIVASSKLVALGPSDKMALVREYLWGWLEISDPKVSEFATLREILLYSHMEELKEVTNDVLYERYRTRKLSEDPEFNAADSAARAPMTASRANLNAHLQQPTASVYPSAPNSAMSQHSQHSQLVLQKPSAPRAASQAEPYSPASQHSVHSSNSQPRGPAPPAHLQPHLPQHQQQEYVSRENNLREEEAHHMRDEKKLEAELEQQRQELTRRELELARLEERLRHESRQLNLPPSKSLQQRIHKLGD